MRILKKIAFVVAGLAALLAGVGFLLPRTVHVERSAVIAAPRATVFTLVDGYRLFNRWSPWAALDPSAAYAYEGPEWGVGATMSWTGDPKTVGSGKQAITASRPFEEVDTDLSFSGQGTAKQKITLAPEGGGTKVTWGLDIDMGAGPLFRFFGFMMDGMIGKDFEKGLASLKSFAESLPKEDFADLKVEVVDAPAVQVAYVEGTSGKGDQEIGAALGAAYAKVGTFMGANGLKQAGAPITINTKWDDTGYGFDAAIPVDRAPDKDIPAASPVKVKSTYAGKALKVVHKGSYRDLPATYMTIAAYIAAHGYEKPAPGWDEYVSDPGKTAEAELLTNILVPVR
jgi:effector-binding domain-containing protein